MLDRHETLFNNELGSLTRQTGCTAQVLETSYSSSRPEKESGRRVGLVNNPGNNFTCYNLEMGGTHSKSQYLNGMGACEFAGIL